MKDEHLSLIEQLKGTVERYKETLDLIDKQIAAHAEQNERVPNIIDQKKIDEAIDRYKPRKQEERF